MTITVNVGYSQKLGRPDFGSIGASCHLECQLDERLAGDDPQTFQAKVQQLYAACAQAVEAELHRRQSTTSSRETIPRNGSRKHAKTTPATTESRSPAANAGTSVPRASQRQLDYLEQLARQIEGLGTRRLESLAGRICDQPLADLSSFDASRVIDTLKAVKEGRLKVEVLFAGDGR